MAFFGRNTFCILTGGSQGLGREIAVQMSQEWCREGAQCNLVLISRNMQGMEETKSLISSAPGVGVHLVQGDLSKLDTLDALFTAAIKYADTDKHEQFVLLHNAGTTGDLTRPMIEQTDPQVIQEYMALNFTSMYVLTARFLTQFKTGHRMVINHSSFLSIQVLPSLSYYSSGKAARNALMAVLAAENPNVRVLSYCPGISKTEMSESVKNNTFSSKTTEALKHAEQCHSGRTDDPIANLVKILKEDEFENGAFVRWKPWLT